MFFALVGPGTRSEILQRLRLLTVDEPSVSQRSGVECVQLLPGFVAPQYDAVHAPKRCENVEYIKGIDFFFMLALVRHLDTVHRVYTLPCAP